MGKPHLEVADVFRAYGEDYRRQHALSMSIGQRRGMRAIELCRTAALGGHVDRCDHCGHEVISYNSCRNRHCPKCQNLDKALWREARQNEVLPVPYYHVVFTLPAPLAPVALQNKRLVYELLFRAVSRTLLRIGA
ncbi:MAG TPA: transposase zinc-binding domain-containing protein, partial [Armatimonadota bacterium]|nr:transposase zinc-binding domain-containing protein [Armatimonadota bacterium]